MERRGHFFSAAAEAMRRILIGSARHKRSQKQGGNCCRADIDLESVPAEKGQDRLLALDEALTTFSAVDPRKAELVKLRFFAGLTIADAALALGISETTANHDWAYARAWLQREIARQER